MEILEVLIRVRTLPVGQFADTTLAENPLEMFILLHINDVILKNRIIS